MKKSINWVSWGLVLIAINLGAFPIAAFSLFGTAEGTSIFSLDYLIAFSILLIANLVSIQLFIAIRKQNQKEFLIGLVFAIIEVISFTLFVFTGTSFAICITLLAIAVVGAAVLLIKSIIIR